MGAYDPNPMFCVQDDYGRQHNTSGRSLFAAAANALQWFEVDCLEFGTARRLRDHETLRITVQATYKPKAAAYRVRVERIRRWIVESRYAIPWWSTWR